MRALAMLSILLGFPALEIFATVRVAQTIGWWLLPWLLASALLGVRVIRKAGQRLPARLFAALYAGQPPNLALLDSFRPVLAGLLLIFPGVASDALALVLLLLPHPKAAPPGAADGIIEGEWERIDEK